MQLYKKLQETNFFETVFHSSANVVIGSEVAQHFSYILRTNLSRFETLPFCKNHSAVQIFEKELRSGYFIARLRPKVLCNGKRSEQEQCCTKTRSPTNSASGVSHKRVIGGDRLPVMRPNY